MLFNYTGTKSGTAKEVPDWVDGAVVRASVLGTTANTAQVYTFNIVKEKSKGHDYLSSTHNV